jgi:ketosteroid isomerase-like protein
MTEARTESPEVEFLRQVYAAFNRGETEAVLAKMHPDVDWPNGWEGGWVHGRAQVREYWKRQFQQIHSRVEPQAFRIEKDGRIAIEVHQIVHDNDGKLVADRMVEHVYQLNDGLIQSLEIRS